MLTLDHIIIRAADPAATLAVLSERGGFPCWPSRRGSAG